MSNEISAEIAQIQTVMREDRPAYDRDEAMQERLHTLYEARESGSDVPAPRRDELGEIRRIMRDDPRRYFNDEEMQERYRQLLRASDAPAASGAAAHGIISVLAPSEWVKQGGDPAEYQARRDLVREVNDVLVSTGAVDRARFSASFEALPPSVHAAAFGELMNRRAVAAYPLTEDEMKALTAPAWRDLIREWGYDAARKAGIVRERTFRIIERLPESDIPGFVRWIDTIPAEAFKTLARKLAGT